jgi:hypothetical protein
MTGVVLTGEHTLLLLLPASPEPPPDPHRSGIPMAKDPRSAGPRPPFPHQQQPPPGKTHALEPKADHGEQSYRGHGWFPGCSVLITTTLPFSARTRTLRTSRPRRSSTPFAPTSKACSSFPGKPTPGTARSARRAGPGVHVPCLGRGNIHLGCHTARHRRPPDHDVAKPCPRR